MIFAKKRYKKFFPGTKSDMEMSKLKFMYINIKIFLIKINGFIKKMIQY